MCLIIRILVTPYCYTIIFIRRFSIPYRKTRGGVCMNKLIGGALALLLFVGVGLVVAQSQEVTMSVTPVVDAIKELVGIQSKIADGVALKGEYVVNGDAINYETFSVLYKVMPVGTCDYAFYALRGDRLVSDIKVDIASWDGWTYRDLTHEKSGTLKFDDDYYMVYLNMSSWSPYGNLSIGNRVGYFEYSCN